ncbi:ATP-binding protein [Candidatus Parcubacteria bacterium]|nr:ATP-binding protein [Candidatus Parcubacteria bacterium]
MYIKRKIEDDILRYLNRKEIIAIVGPRQCGKTTTLLKIFNSLKQEKKVFLNFEDQEVLSLFENNIKRFAKVYVVENKYVFIDEFQYAKNGGKLLKYLYDLYGTKIIISGSSATDLTIKAIKFLVGRIFVLQMYPFDFSEFLLYKDKNYANIYSQLKIDLKNIKIQQISKEEENALKNYYEDYAVWGGYPQVVLTDDLRDKQEILKNIYNTYFLRDVKSILGLIDDYKLNNLIKALALQVGNTIEYNELSRISEFSLPTLKKYFNFLSKTYICDFIRPFYTNKRKEIVKNKKVFFYDTGLRNYIVNDFRFLNSRTDKGALLENAFWTQIIKNGHSAQYWRDKNKNEVDFVVDIGEGKMFAMEIKNSKSKCKRLPQSFVKDYYENTYMYFFYLQDNLKCDIKNRLFIPLF